MFQVHTKGTIKEQHLTTASLLPLLALLLQAMAAKPLVTVPLPTVRVLDTEVVVAAAAVEVVVVVAAVATTVRVEGVATTKEAAAVAVATVRVVAVVTIKEAMDMEVYRNEYGSIIISLCCYLNMFLIFNWTPSG